MQSEMHKTFSLSKQFSFLTFLRGNSCSEEFEEIIQNNNKLNCFSPPTAGYAFLYKHNTKGSHFFQCSIESLIKHTGYHLNY